MELIVVVVILIIIFICCLSGRENFGEQWGNHWTDYERMYSYIPEGEFMKTTKDELCAQAAAPVSCFQLQNKARMMAMTNIQQMNTDDYVRDNYGTRMDIPQGYDIVCASEHAQYPFQPMTCCEVKRDLYRWCIQNNEECRQTVNPDRCCQIMSGARNCTTNSAFSF